MADVSPKDAGNDPQELDRTLEKLFESIDMLPKAVRAKAQEEIRVLQAMLRERRGPRLMLYGRRGTGKSQLTNAIFSAPVQQTGDVHATTGKALWRSCTFGGRKVELLDTRGVQEGSAPVEADPAESAEESLLIAVRDKSPDVIALLVKATDVDVAIAADLDILERVHREAVRVHGTEIKIVPVLTQCDQLHPSDIKFPPHDEEDAEKQANVEEAASVLWGHLQRHAYLSRHLAGDVVPTAALVFFDSRGNLIKKRDYRWNIDTLALRMQEVLPDDTQIEFARLAQFRKVQKRLASRIVTAVSVVCGSVGATPIPLADLPFLAVLQTTMVTLIAYISGREMSLATSKELIVALGGNIGAGFALREVVRGLLKVLPGAGNVASGVVAAAGTKSLGQAAIFYFIDKRPLDAVRHFEAG
ncbi:GTPase family protein [Streptomyces sp. NPDC058412]|uniref:GTPase family protein n=1 Tax=Streptomyces sp. NPDC058412 TaxID=3346486 RepID=UPI0036603276